VLHRRRGRLIMLVSKHMEVKLKIGVRGWKLISTVDPNLIAVGATTTSTLALSGGISTK
jgi:hypothetical protein